jgi:TonB family protein
MQQTGIFFVNAAGQAPLTAFPREYQRRLLGTLDRHFMTIFGVCALVLGGTTLLLSLRDVPDTASEKEILRIQERYAQLVLNQPKPKPVEEEKTETVSEGPKKKAVEEEKEEEVEVDREKETFVEKQKRKETTKLDRIRKREEIQQQVQSSGIFAAITATSGGGSGVSSNVSDLLGATDAVSGLGDISVSKGTFATRKVDAADLKTKRGERTSGVGIEKKDVCKAAVTQIASTGSVNITSEPPKIKGDEKMVMTSKACINRIIVRQRARLKRVYENWLKRDPQLAGRIKISFTILPSGAVSNVSVPQSTTNNASFDRNIVRYVQRWDFSACAISEPTEIEVPFAFEGAS